MWGALACWRGVVIPSQGSVVAAPPLPPAAYAPSETKCWADGVYQNGEPSGESCHRYSVSPLGLCKEHLAEITGHS